jgi:deoxyadenosine/deoxycytidine kinase
MGLSFSEYVSDDIIAGVVPTGNVSHAVQPQRRRPDTPRIVSLDGNIGVGKTTLLNAIRERFPDILIVPEPVDTWTSLKDESGKNLLELFYEDKKRWAYTFQNAAILSRLRLLQEAVANAKPGQIILTERSVLTDKFVFAEMLRSSNDMNVLEGSLYNMWYNTFASKLPMAGILYVTTGVGVAQQRIQKRGRQGEESISVEYLEALDRQHRAWISSTTLPVLKISTEESAVIGDTLDSIQRFFELL